MMTSSLLFVIVFCFVCLQDGSVVEGGESKTVGSPQKNVSPSETTAATTPQSFIPLAENSLHVDISDALSEKDKVKFTVHTRTNLPIYQKNDFFVVRQHEEFVWLHDRFEENEAYGGYIVREWIKFF